MAAGKVTDEDLEQLRRWLDSLSRFAKTDIDVQASRTRIAEEQADELVWLLEAVLIDCGVSVADPQVRASIRRRLQQSGEWPGPGAPPKVTAPGVALVGEVVG